MGRRKQRKLAVRIEPNVIALSERVIPDHDTARQFAGLQSAILVEVRSRTASESICQHAGVHARGAIDNGIGSEPASLQPAAGIKRCSGSLSWAERTAAFANVAIDGSVVGEKDKVRITFVREVDPRFRGDGGVAECDPARNGTLSQPAIEEQPRVTGSARIALKFGWST
jgi:hypothetical protein